MRYGDVPDDRECARDAGVEAPLLYHDMAPPGASPGETWMFILTFDPAFDARQLDAGMDLVPFFSKLCEQQTTRVVRSHRALVEKITVFEAGLDDRCIEVANGMARRQTPALRESELV